jgi:hypothetical protein
LLDGIKGVAFTQNTADPNVDFGSIHLYPEKWNNFLAAVPWIADHARIARSLGKPLAVLEYGASQNTAALIGAWLKTMDVEKVGGSAFWQCWPPSVPAGMRDEFAVVYPPASAVSDALARAAATATAKNGTPISPPGPTPLDARVLLAEKRLDAIEAQLKKAGLALGGT